VVSAVAIARRACPRCGATYDADAAFCAKDGARLGLDDDGTPDSDPYIGTLVSEDIEIRSVAGVGAMGRVYRAHQRGIDRDVAVKILHRELSGNAQLVQRFHREAKIASKLQHPHVVEVYLAGQLADKALYIVMEYLDGRSLAAALAASGGAFSPSRALSIALQICDAVGEGHARGIVHRDLKPENVMLVRRAEVGDWVKVLDFGIAKGHLGEQSVETAAGLVFGTARYISPEGAEGRTVAPSGDVYSIAVMVYQMLSGRTPFDAEPVGLLIKHIHEPPPPITSWPGAEGLHPALARVVMDNLAKRPADREQGARAFGAALAAAAREAGVSFSEAGVVARLGSLEAGRGSPALEPTLNDEAGLLGGLASRDGASPRLSVIAPSRSPAAEASPLAEASRAVDHRSPAPRRPVSLAVVALAFLLGAAVAVIVTEQLARRADNDHAAYVSRARRALADSKYASPPGDNVRELVAAGLVKWPDDNELLQLRSDAAHEMVTRALAARGGGDVGGARGLVRDALALDTTDRSARMLLAQYQEEADALAAGIGLNAGAPRVLLEAPALARPGQKLEIVARLAAGAAGPKAQIAGIKITLLDNGKTSGGAVVPLGAGDPRELRAAVTAPAVGSYDLVFEATVDGAVVRAQHDLDVLR
jgi:serine/threonine-protein kinase